MSTKPLFIPLTTGWFNKFAAGEKPVELRPYGDRWNERTCAAGRAVTLSKGYGKKHRLQGEVTRFEKIEGVSNKRREAAHRAHDELSKVKANETCEVRLQRAIGNAQGILAAVLDHCPGMVLYPEDLPPRRRAGDMPMTATEVMRRQRGMY